MICGFPGETEAHFKTHMILFKIRHQLFICILAILKRPNTAAIELLNSVSPTVKLMRSKITQSFQIKKKRAYYLKFEQSSRVSC